METPRLPHLVLLDWISPFFLNYLFNITAVSVNLLLEGIHVYTAEIIFPYQTSVICFFPTIHWASTRAHHAVLATATNLLRQLLILSLILEQSI